MTPTDSRHVQMLFREVNEQIRRLHESSLPLELVCECGNIDCTERLILAVADCDALRSRGDGFLVSSGHGAEAPSAHQLELERA